MKIVNMHVQSLDSPLGIQTQNPVFDYMLERETQDTEELSQGAYRLLAATKREFLEMDTGDLWDSGIVRQKEPFNIVYDGAPLSSRSLCYWKVKVWDDAGRDIGWSRIDSWEMGLYPEDWRGKWIGQGEGYDGDKSEAPLFACDFSIDLSDAKKTARLYISGLGIFKAYLNGVELDGTLFDPGESDFTRTIYYVTYDVTSGLQNGKNTLGVILGNGQYTNFQMDPVMTLPDGTSSPRHRYQKNDGRVVKPGIAGNKKLLAQLEITDQDGRRYIAAVSGTDWKWTHGPHVFQNWYGGEDYDATKEIADWNSPMAKRDGWMSAVVMNAPAGRLTAREFLPIRIMQKGNAKTVTKLEHGRWLIDMGFNGAGFPEICLHTTPDMRGNWIKMYPAELLNSEKTGVDQASCTQSWNERYHCVIMDSYRIKGTGEEIWHPAFSYQGYQYIELDGWQGNLTTENIRYCIIRTANRKAGFFNSSQERLNKVNQMVERSMESNMFGTFTDCPQIEKLGWIETSHLMFRSLAGAYDIRAWMKKIIHDIADAQVDEKQAELAENEPAGFVPAIIPEFQRIVGLHRDPNWNGACIFTPWEYYQYYGDKSVLWEMYPIMVRYLSYLSEYVQNGILDNYAQMGEWGQYRESTPTVLVATCAYYRMLRIMEQTALLVGRQEESADFGQRAEQTQKDFHVHALCYDSGKRIYGNNSQASYGCVLYSGIVLQEQEQEAVDRLEAAVRARDYHLSSGEVGLKQVLCALGEHGRNETAYRMIMNETAPSYAFFADAGLTALPEYWNCEELWNGMVRSRNHAMMGHVREWISFYMLGVRSLKPGFSKIVLDPWMPDEMTYMEGTVPTPYGDIRIKCHRENGALAVESRIPPGIQVIGPGQTGKLAGFD